MSIPLVGELSFLPYPSESGSVKWFQRLFLHVYNYGFLFSAFFILFLTFFEVKN